MIVEYEIFWKLIRIEAWKKATDTIYKIQRLGILPFKTICIRERIKQKQKHEQKKENELKQEMVLTTFMADWKNKSENRKFIRALVAMNEIQFQFTNINKNPVNKIGHMQGKAKEIFGFLKIFTPNITKLIKLRS